MSKRMRRAGGMAGAALLLGFAGAPGLHAQETDKTKALEERIAKLERELAAVEAELAGQAHAAGAGPGTAAAAVPAVPVLPVVAQVAKPKGAPDSAPGSAAPTASAVNPDAVAEATAGARIPGADGKHKFFERKPGEALTFYTMGGELTPYGNLDVSVETMTKGIRGLLDGNGNAPVGDMGWLPDLSTNLAYVGVRGLQKTGIKDWNFVYQLETQLSISSTSGTDESNSSESNDVKGGLTSRNSYIGLGSKKAGAFVFGKTDAPYKQSTQRMNPFYAEIGDYAAIMGNTGGDNRVEFATRLDHAIWWTSPKWKGWETDVLFSPGQNRASDSSNIAAGEASCTGGNIPGSGGSLPFACNDGSFSDAVSAAVTYTSEPLYVVAAYERHMKVNRESDITGEYANPAPAYYLGDVADEDAGKVGVQYTFAKKTTVSAIYETMHRYVPYYLEFQNERQRQGSWLAVTQVLSKSDSFSAGWARAYRTPGDPGQHNTARVMPPGGQPGDAVGGRGADNSANLLSFVYKRRIGPGLVAYATWAGTFNGPYAHYDLGAGGRGVTTDCHDASDATGGESSDPHCWAGGQLKGVSVGLDKRF